MRFFILNINNICTYLEYVEFYRDAKTAAGFPSQKGVGPNPIKDSE